MASIYFDRDNYEAGGEAVITWSDGVSRSLVRVMAPGGGVAAAWFPTPASGSATWQIPTDAETGTYTARLHDAGTILAHDTARVGGGAPPTDKGKLAVTTTPTGALVMVNGVSCGETPVSACELSTGSKTVTITKSGYNPETRSVTIAAGQTSNLGTITLTPTGAPLPGFTDTGKVTPSTIEVDPATYDVMFKKSGYKDKTITNVVVTEGATKPVSATLEPEVAPPVTKTVTFVSVPSGASVDVVAV